MTAKRSSTMVPVRRTRVAIPSRRGTRSSVRGCRTAASDSRPGAGPPRASTRMPASGLGRASCPSTVSGSPRAMAGASSGDRLTLKAGALGPAPGASSEGG